MLWKYCEFIDAITADELYEGLLAYGLFSEKLPPIFSSVSFFDYCQTFSPYFSERKQEYILFRIMRNTGTPRLMGIPTPMSYQYLCSALHDNWSNIKEHFHAQTDQQEYRISRIHIRKLANTKALFRMNYKNWQLDGNPEVDLLIRENAVSKYLVKADISTCFPSIYTHSIPWALVGKKEAKDNMGDKSLWYNKIDNACQNLKYGETHGLLIGPHASNLLSEIILTVIDRELYERGYRFIRNIDDYDCYVESHEKAELFLSHLEEELQKYDLPLNHKKTKIIKLPVGIQNNWLHRLANIQLSSGTGKVKYPQVNSFIDTALELADEENNYAVINYAMKKLSGLALSNNAKRLASRRFLHMAAIYPYLLPLMEDYVFKPYDVNKEEIKELSDTIYLDAKRVNNFESMCYAIYFALRYDFRLNELDTNYVIEQRDCITLVLARLYYLRENHGKIDASDVKPYNKLARELKLNEMGRYWLFCFEALKKGTLSGDWAKMKDANVSFIKPEFRF